MRELIFWALIIFTIPVIWRNAFFGVTLYTVFNVIRPEMLFWGGDGGAKIFIVIMSVTTFTILIKNSSQIKDIFKSSELILLLFLYFALIISILSSSYTLPKQYFYANEIFKIFILCSFIYIKVKTEKDLKLFENILLLAFTFLGIWGIDQYFRGNYRLEGLGGQSWGDSNGVAAIFVLFLPLALNKLLYPAGKKDWYIGFATSFILTTLIICTFSRGGLLGMLVVSFVMVIRSKYKIRVFFMCIILIVLMSPFLSDEYMERMGTMKSSETLDYSAKSRIILWKAGLMIFFDNPITGSGFMSYPYEKDKYRGRFDDIDPRLREYVFDITALKVTHNTYIQMLSEGGVILAIPFVLLIFGNLWENFKLRKEYPLNVENKDMMNLLSCIESGILGHCLCIFFLNAIVGIFLYIQLVVSAIIRNNIKTKQITLSTLNSI